MYKNVKNKHVCRFEAYQFITFNIFIYKYIKGLHQNLDTSKWNILVFLLSEICCVYTEHSFFVSVPFKATKKLSVRATPFKTFI